MMILSSTHIERIRKSLQENPLQQNDVRRIEGLGELYLSFSDHLLDGDLYTELYKLNIDDVSYTFYSKL